MNLTLLLDLDDTLLTNSMEKFLPGYLQGLAQRLAPYVDPQRIAPQLMAATNEMVENQDPGCTLAEVFDAAFYPALKISKQQVETAIAEFYAQDFPRLRSSTSPRPEAVRLVEQALQRGYRVVIATAPLFPRTAILERLRWAGLPLEAYPFSLVPDYSSFHFAKPNPAYFTELLAQIGWRDGPVLMVGDDYTADIASAAALGIPVFWIKNGKPASNGPTEGIPQGELKDLLPWLDQQSPASLQPRFTKPQAMIALLKSTPAALASLSFGLDAHRLASRPTPQEWSPGEIFCHLRDADLEVNQPRLEQILSSVNPFLAARETDQWAIERDYLHQDHRLALTAFSTVRFRLVQRLAELDEQDWRSGARHAIFGPTTLLELVQFITEHDRLHIQQFLQAISAQPN